ncbi:formylmethanofuran dehydrogenase subunit C [Planctomycetes bacterium K23_9]|uniref:Formyltransferase/hydrolase complex Fhc subunit C n=1 Tax=Stieleria marina TaxID=1930275 RepID=A0A517NSE0_9BACT|nr:Formyltransferase/hydrolase complex Fhc subunit C [Planctomycetes bacterium K23_9]
MSTITLTLKESPSVPLETEVITPDTVADLSRSEIAALTVYHGKRVCRLDDFFDIDGEKSEHIEIHGDLHRVRMIGKGMSRGSLSITGNVGMHLGAQMSGGTITVNGNASDWIGAEMTGGLIRIHGNGGGQIGAAYRGSLAGMRNGTILVDGTAGLEVGMRMKRGTIVIGKTVRDFAGLQMKGGTIVMLSGAEIRTGAWMNRGTIISCQPTQVMPTFAYSGAYNPTFVNVYAKHLTQYGIDLPYKVSAGTYSRYAGDMGVSGKGELLVWNPV